MQIEVIRGAVELARDDGEFRLNARGWDGWLTIGVDDERWRVDLTDGAPADPTATAGDDVATATWEGADHDHVTISASARTWANLLVAQPAPGFVDVTGASVVADMVISPMPTEGSRFLAIRRFGELLRHAYNGSDPTPRTSPSPSRHGELDHATGRYVHLDLDGVDHRVYFEEAGEGIGLLCQHTAGADGRQFRHFLEDERITSKYRVVVYDLPYHGKSLPPAGQAWWAERYSLSQELAMTLPTVLAQVLGLDRPVFIGSSVGGMLALDLARYHPDDYRAVISLEGGLHVDIPEGGTPTAMDEDPAVHAVTMMMIMSPTATETARQETRLHYAQGAPGVFPGDIDYYMIEHDLRGEAGNIDTGRCAVHLLTGEYDFPTVEWTRRAGAEIAGSTMEIMEGLGHFPMSEDHEGLMRYVLPLLDEIAAAPTVEAAEVPG